MKLLRNRLIKVIVLLFLVAAVTLSSAPCILAQEKSEIADQNSTMDLVFVIDNSGSMQKNDPKFITPEVVSSFVEQLPESAQVGMVLFDQQARLLTPMTLLESPGERQQVIDSLSKIDYKGLFTNTPVGIERAVFELKTNGREGSQRGIVLITDGIVDVGDPEKDRELTVWLKKDVTAKCKQEGIRIFGIALTEQADFSLIQTLAARTNGEYFRTFLASEISGVLRQIKALMKPPESEPLPELAPLPLLPVPAEEEPQKAEQAEAEQAEAEQAEAEQAEAEQAEAEQAKAEQAKAEQAKAERAKAEQAKAEQAKAKTSPPAPAPDDSENVVVTEKMAWIISIALATLVIVLLGALIFLFFQNSRRRQILPVSQAKDLNIPEAYLVDQGDVLAKDVSPVKLDKESIRIGRGQSCELVIDAPAISGFHATIEFRNMSFYLEDQRSTNGTMLNERKLDANQHVRLKDGDRITFATYPFVFKMAGKSPFRDPVMLSMTALEDDEAAATIVLDLDGADSKQGLISCIQTHLMQIYGLSAKHKEFVNTYFAHDILDIIATTAHENLQKTVADNEQYCTTVVKNKSLYVICSLPGPIEMAEQWYAKTSKGFTQFIFKWIQSEHYLSSQCDQLCVVTFGQDPATWVSISIVPTHARPDPIEIMSVDFLNQEEKSSLALDFDHHGRVI